ncbi:MAG: hypothetical protein JJ974_03915 [Phycisphaerales bacterium]|nr:hypothetical protein [Phycisphaerales bacterium]
MKRTNIISTAALVALAAGTAHADFILSIDSNSDRVMILDAFDGSVINDNFLDIGAAASAIGVSSTPIEVVDTGSEFWVSDQVGDRIWRYSHSGALLGNFGGDGDLNNIRGMHRVGNTMYVAMGSNSDNFSEGIVSIDTTTRNINGVFLDRPGTDVSYFDIVSVGNELLVTNIDSGNDGIERYSLDGTYLGNLVTSDGVSSVDFPQQMYIRDNGNILVGGFSPPSGVHEFAADGTALGIVAGLDFGPRGAIDLGNGEILWGNGTWLRTDDRIILEGVSTRFFTRTTIPSPSALALLGLGGLVSTRRRR